MDCSVAAYYIEHHLDSEDAIRTIIFSDLHRLFVSEEGGGDIVGVFTLTDAAPNKSGSCQACVSSRITV